MHITPELKRRVQIILAAAIILAAVRAAYIIYERRPAKVESARSENAPLNPDYYVTPKKLYPHDLKSARQLTLQPVWVKEGYRYTYYPYNKAGHHADFSHEAGLLLPIEKLQITDVAAVPSPSTPGQRQIVAVFHKNAKACAVPIGTEAAGNYQIYSDEMFYIQDPHELYKHWPAEVWDSIARHEVKPGMNELQADFAIGMGVPQRSDDPNVKTVDYPNGGNPISITYRNGKAAEINRGSGG